MTGSDLDTGIINVETQAVSPPAALPLELQERLDRLRHQEQAIRKQVERQLDGEKRRLLGDLRRMQDEFTRVAKLDQAIAVRAARWKLEDELYSVTAASPSLTAFRGQAGESRLFRVTGSTAGVVWGNDLYTDDSSLGAAAVHAGVLEPGETDTVRVTFLPGLPTYQGSTRHGVTTSPWTNQGGSYSSYRVELAEPLGTPATADHAADDVRPDPGSLSGFSGEIGDALLFRVIGTVEGAVWGSNPYTDDSDLSTVAVHAGVLQPGETGLVRVTPLPGRQSYSGSNGNGVASRDWTSGWSGSYRIERADGAAADPRRSLSGTRSAVPPAEAPR